MLTPLTLTLAWQLVARLVALAVTLQTIELLQLHRVAANDGIWRWSTLARDWSALPRPLGAVVTQLLRARPFVALLVVRLAAALALGLFALTPWTAPLPALLLVTTVLVQLRWRGTFNGGSDFMTLVILTALTVASWAPPDSRVATGALLYEIMIQYQNGY